MKMEWVLFARSFNIFNDIKEDLYTYVSAAGNVYFNDFVWG